MEDNRKVWFNDKLIPWREATVPILSHGFSRASAIFEFFCTYTGPDGAVAFRIDEHLKRLAKSAELLGMKMAFTDEQIMAAVASVVKANNVEHGMIKLMAFWGEEALINLVLDAPLDLAIFAIHKERDPNPEASPPISACITKWRKLHPETVPVEAKVCANYLNGYLARKDAIDRGFDIGIMLCTDGFLGEGSIESVFIVKDSVLKVPPLGRVLSSITRMSILQAVPTVGITVAKTPITAEELRTADEIFICHTGLSIRAVERLDDRELNTPGPVTLAAIGMMEDILNFKNERFLDWFQPLA